MRPALRGSLLAALLLLPVAPARLRAQGGLPWGVTAFGAATRARTVYPGHAEALHGTLFGGEARLTPGALVIRIEYAEGHLDGDSAGPPRRKVVEGAALIGVTPVTGLEITAGPRVRAYLTSAGTQRWLFWELHGRYEMPILGRNLRGYAEIWGAPLGSVNVTEAFQSGRGGAAGLVIQHVAGPLSLRFSYAIDEGRLASGRRRETVEGATIAFGYDHP